MNTIQWGEPRPLRQSADAIPFPLDALAAKLKLELKTIELLPLQPYFAEKLNIDVTRGYVSIAGDVDARLSGAGAASGARPRLPPGRAGCGGCGRRCSGCAGCRGR